ncbi:MAG: hypothetical protein L0Z50_38185 [Verrucomicrobiales bacterium]|nr:hypothetical protein [Verrucomicrobiales bacterium]
MIVLHLKIVLLLTDFMLPWTSKYFSPVINGRYSGSNVCPSMKRSAV